MSTTVVCLANDVVQADSIVNSLKMAGFGSGAISVLMPDTTGFRDAGFEKHSKAPEGTATGAASGAVLGGALGWLAGIGALAIPGAGPFIAAGPLMAALSAAAVGGAVGGFSGGLIGLGIPEIEAKQYEGKVYEGNKIFISVHTNNRDEEKTVEAIFKNGRAEDINCIQEASVPGGKRAK